MALTMGFCLLGLAAFTSQGISGCVYQMWNHGIISPALFLIAGVIYDRAHHREIEGFGGLAKQIPEYSAIVGLAFMASLGLPGLNGFISEALCFVGPNQGAAIRVPHEPSGRGTKAIPAKSSLLSFLALKLLGNERYAHVGDYGFDQAPGLFVGINKLPKCTSMSTYSYSIDDVHIQRLQRAFVKSASKLIAFLAQHVPHARRHQAVARRSGLWPAKAGAPPRRAQPPDSQTARYFGKTPEIYHTYTHGCSRKEKLHLTAKTIVFAGTVPRGKVDMEDLRH